MVKDKLFEVKETKQILLQKLAQKHKIDLDEYELEKFSREKSLLDYQQEALENAFSILNLYFKKCDGDREKFYALLEIKDSLDIKLDKDDLLKEYFKTKDSRFEFSQIANQMCFWMATGSGKTIVIIKLIEMLAKAMENGLIPKKDIFFFSANDDLLEAFKKEVSLYNNSHQNTINCYSLKDYEKFKKANDAPSLFGEINIFLYSAYNLTSESKEKQISFKEVWNNGNNYVILDEAHKGNKSYSKMQHIMNILSKNGFLFNFSATFTSKQDIAMTVLNLNVSEWIKKGYGKRPILLDDSDLSAFKEKEDFNESAKQKAILKALIALYLCKIARIECQKDAYHDPMMLIFSNSVTAENSDAHIFFKTLKNVVDNDNEELFEEAKEDMRNELKKKDKDYLIPTENEEGVESLSEKVPALTLSEIKEQVFHSASGNLEAIYYPSNTNEILLKLDSAESPFMLIRIGNIIEWLKVILAGIKISKSYKDLEAFKNIDKSKINILLGSRMFSEGWDTTRPNVTLFLNIGMDKEAKTFIMQSLGRTLRIESFDKDRKRAGHIGKKAVLELETSFIFATNPQAIKAISDETKKMGEASAKEATIKLEKNPLIPKNLLIPKYKKKKIKSNEISQAGRMSVSEQNCKMAELYAKNISNALMALRHNIVDIDRVKLTKTLCDKSNFNESKDKHYKNIHTLINEVQKRSYVSEESLDGFKELENEITHYEKIKVKEDEKDKIEEKIKEILSTKKSNSTYKYLERHYYNPLICIDGTVDFTHIVKVKSEIEFIKALVKLIEEEDIDKKVKSWHFSKIDESVDSIYIPYLQDAKDKKFYPDFIFWIEKNDGTIKIVFVDPKGTEYASYLMKCDGFERIFKDYKKGKNKKVEVSLLFVNINNDTNDKVSKQFREMWMDVGNSNDLMKIFS